MNDWRWAYPSDLAPTLPRSTKSRCAATNGVLYRSQVAVLSSFKAWNCFQDMGVAASKGVAPMANRPRSATFGAFHAGPFAGPASPVEDLVNADDIDDVHICTPNHLHACWCSTL